MQGKFTGYSTCAAVIGGQQDCLSFNADGKPTQHRSFFYDSNHILIRAKFWYDGADSYNLATYDPSDGLEVENDLAAFVGDRTVNVSMMSYDENGDPVRRDTYDGQTKRWYASIDFQDSLSIKKSAQYTDGTTYVSLHHYDAKRVWTSSDIYVNGVLLFRFVYVRQPDGTIVKSQAVGLNGDLWAEYTDTAIDEVSRTGRYPSDPSRGTIYKQGSWW